MKTKVCSPFAVSLAWLVLAGCDGGNCAPKSANVRGFGSETDVVITVRGTIIEGDRAKRLPVFRAEDGTELPVVQSSNEQFRAGETVTLRGMVKEFKPVAFPVRPPDPDVPEEFQPPQIPQVYGIHMTGGKAFVLQEVVARLPQFRR